MLLTSERMRRLLALSLLLWACSKKSPQSSQPPPVTEKPVVAIAIAPHQASVLAGGTAPFSATVTGTAVGQSTAATWSVQETGMGTVSETGLYTAPATAGTFHVVATSIADPTKNAVAEVTVSAVPVIVVSVDPPSANIGASTSTDFTAMVTGGSSGQSTDVTWSIDEGKDGGTIEAGHYTAPSPGPGTFHVRATSVADPTKSDAATVTVFEVPDIKVQITPDTATTISDATVPFQATVTGTITGQPKTVTWSVQESGGGSVDDKGVYTPPQTAGTYHVVAASVADPTKTASAEVTVSLIEVDITPPMATMSTGGAQTFQATVKGTSGSQSTDVTWSIEEAGGGTIDAAGNYVAPDLEADYHVVATSVADPKKNAVATVTVATFAALPSDRRAAWHPGVVDGIPDRNQICATVNAGDLGNGTQDATSTIQKAIDGCAVGQVVKLSEGTFRIDDDLLVVSKGITLRGSGPGKTILERTNGATPGSYMAPVTEPLIVVGPNRWPAPDDSSSRDLSADAAKGDLSVTISDAKGFAAGTFVLLDEDEFDSGAWMDLPDRSGQPTTDKMWASDRVVWQRHQPPEQYVDDPFPDAESWFCRTGRAINEVKEVAKVVGNTVTFTTPLTISYRTAHKAQLTRYTGGNAHVKNVGVEDLTVTGGSDGAIRFEAAAYSWVRNVEDTIWLGEGVAINHSFRIEVRENFIHDGAWPEPGGGGYAISLADGSAEALIENNIVMGANKMIVVRSSGAGSVVAYNYMDDGHILTNPGWQEVGLNASHMAGAHHVLFEGNESFNYDADCTHGNAIYHTVFRNHLTGYRRDFTDDPGGGNPRAAGLGFGSWWHSFFGNVLGTEGKMAGWKFEDLADNPGNLPWGTGQFVWKLGYEPTHWEQAPDPMVRSTVIRHGNFDFLTSTVEWDPSIASHDMPASLYLKQKPAFFNAGKGYDWPWVDAAGPVPLKTLPARARYDAGTPFVQP